MGRHRENRSNTARQRRWLRRFVRRNSFQDRRIRESINVLDGVELIEALGTSFDVVVVSVSTEFDEGEVLSDFRGGGSLEQRSSIEKEYHGEEQKKMWWWRE